MHFKFISLNALAPLFAALSMVILPNQSYAQRVSIQPSYADLADLAAPAQYIVQVKIDEAITVEAERVPNVPPNFARVYIEADVVALIRGQQGLPQTIKYIIDLPRDSRGKAPRIKGDQFLIFARTNSAARPGEIQLISPDAQIAWSPAIDARVRSVAREMASADSAPQITGVREALHVAGNLTGEGETQIFLETPSGDPVSLTVLRRPGLEPQWAVSLTEIVDSAATIPARDSLLWYQLACGLPAILPDATLLSASPEANRAARRDYQFVLDQLGPCGRTRN